MLRSYQLTLSQLRDPKILKPLLFATLLTLGSILIALVLGATAIDWAMTSLSETLDGWFGKAEGWLPRSTKRRSTLRIQWWRPPACPADLLRSRFHCREADRWSSIARGRNFDRFDSAFALGPPRTSSRQAGSFRRFARRCPPRPVETRAGPRRGGAEGIC